MKANARLDQKTFIMYVEECRAGETTEKKGKGMRQRNGHEETHSPLSDKGLELWMVVWKKYGKDALVNDGTVARALASQCFLPTILARLEGLEEETFLDEIDSGLLKHRICDALDDYDLNFYRRE
ncbi:hypothetical protein JCGZ_12654 [Jatropha curcas]|uniref:Uncharacterized protein n=1 Tax=Jatropha curcas TaxID=180498 RepID=A0A067KDL9_JATCU|nr:hypothetical protein JCGZ_12654 [Jatropha curcas]